MAARRLIFVLVVLFAISIAAAAVAPQRESPLLDEEATSTSSTTESQVERPGSPGGTAAGAIDASAEETETVRANVGDQLELTVSTDVALQVELADLGLLEEATPDAPAQLNILLRDPGPLAITDAQSGDVIGRLVVEETRVAKPAGPPSRDPGSA